MIFWLLTRFCDFAGSNFLNLIGHFRECLELQPSWSLLEHFTVV